MRRDSILFRLAAATAIAGLPVFLAPETVRAQAAGPAPAETDPPARVGALTRIQGSVSFHAAGAESWSPAAVNYPVTQGEGFWTQPGAEARIDVSDTDLVMAGATDIEVSGLDEQALVATLPQGEAYLRVRDLGPGQTYTMVTPRGTVTIAAPGRYDIVAGDTDTPTRLTVLEGTATLGDGAAGEVPAGQAAEITGAAAPFQARLVPAARDPFLDHVLAEERPARAQPVPPPLVAQMPGGADLAEYGTWSQTPQYGEIWYPEVQSDWVPYRDGHWSYVAPWGWTWVDAAPWGFAPFHYGRWVDIGGRWAWTPGAPAVAEAPRYPVYAPALVTFFGVGAAVGVTAALLNSGSVGWVPLGPGEVYRPWFRAGPRYDRDVNIRHVTNVTQITNVFRNTTVNRVTVNQFRNVRAATVVPAAAMATSRPLARVGRAATPQVLASARPVFGHAPVPPTTATVGVTPGLARAVHAVPPPAGTPPRAGAPGPVIRTQAHAQMGPASASGAPRHLAAPPLSHPGNVPPAAGAPAHPPVQRGPGTPPHSSPIGPQPHAPASNPAAHPGEARANAAPAGRTAPAFPGGVHQPSPVAQPAPPFHPTAPAQPHPAPVPHVAPPAAPSSHAPAAQAAPAFHPPSAPAFHPPSAPAFHPPSAPAAHPPAAPAFHPPAAPAFHPAAPPHPAPAPAPPPRPSQHPEPHQQRHPGQP